ncbi:hypothetical protein [Pantoea vagans]|uniref:hypothetical protein n=1 Tax=Pantoea vagans TaxID=470934 RepID=UPI0023AE7282|nr:hypothetical protein [Pantoea vagans]MDE8556980.1 hypothetical protein [Pantoea vagans]MDE8576986.1 hypothetical protein [Pantoea vagans]
MDNSHGLVKGYVDKIRQTAVKAQLGESNDSLKPKFQAVIDEAHQHFSVWINGTPEENWQQFIGQIKFTSNLGGDERFTQALKLAADMAKQLPPPQRKK